MKLIQHLERKLSWRKKKQSGVQGTSGKADKGRKPKKLSSAAIKVGDNEFSHYIRFASLLAPVSTSSVPSYEIVSIRTRSPQQANLSPVVPPQYQSPSPGREAEYDTHIYDRIDCARLSPIADDLALGRRSRYGSAGPTTVTSSYRRNRIKTNPWCSSPWASRKSFHSTKPVYSNIENPYESIDSLDWQETKENYATNQFYHSTKGHIPNYYPELTSAELSPGDYHRAGTYLKGRIPHTLDASYPQSAFDGALCPAEDNFLNQAPSPEFVSESHQLCSEISNYFRPSPLQARRPSAQFIGGPAPPSACNQSHLNKFDSMETIDLTADLADYGAQAMSVWSIADESVRPDQDSVDSSLISGGTSSCESSPKCRKQTALDMNLSAKNSKRKRPDSIYSTRQSKKVDRLKSQLKDVVHAAILKAKKEDTKKV